MRLFLPPCDSSLYILLLFDLYSSAPYVLMVFQEIQQSQTKRQETSIICKREIS